MDLPMNEKDLSPRSVISALIAAFGLAAIHQYLFYGNGFGVSVPIFVCLFYLYIGLFATERMRKPFPRFGWFSFGVVLLLSLTFALFANPLFSVLNVLALLCLVFAHTTYILSPKKRSWSDIRLIWDTLDHMIPQNLRHLATVFRLARSVSARKVADHRKQAIGKVLLGLLIALPLLIIVVGLLTSADSSFDRLLSAIPDWINESLSFGEGTFRTVYIAVLGLLLFGYLWGFVSPRPEPALPVPAPAHDEPLEIRIDPIVAATVLIAINIVYILFVSLQFSYLFGAWRGVLPAGSSYAEYARSGFFELIAVTVINFAILAGTLTFGGQAGKLLRKLNPALLYILVGCSGVMLVSAFTRLLLYEEAYGYTYIRFLSHAFMIYLAVLLACAGLRIRLARLPLAKCFIVVSLAAYVIVNYANMDQVIARKNLERYLENGNIDAQYLTQLSPDTVPRLLRYSREADPELNRQLHERWDYLTREDRKWPAFNLAESRAIHALKEDRLRRP
ncbi:DUF4153 domain-containing protein [Paenibacillus macerans]|uniref:DUF4153 domain-containing protein n=1 Tax=Paenibacillus macerans TaxID=44252 RepID=UPI003D31E814